MTGEEELGPPSLLAAVDQSLSDLPRKPRDHAAVQLLRLYATLLDDAVDRLQDAAEQDEARDFGRMTTAIVKIGPRFERMIDMLGMAPGARPTAPPSPSEEPAGGDPRSVALDKLRTADPGFDPTAFVDPAVTDADT